MPRPTSPLLCLAALLSVCFVAPPAEAGSETVRPGRKTKPGSHRWEHWWAREGEAVLMEKRGAAPTHAPSDSLRERSVRVLRKALRDKAPALRAAAAIGLGKSGSFQDADDLLKLGLHDPAASVRESALLAVGLMGRAEDVPSLAAIMRHRREKRAPRAAAALALGLHAKPEARRALQAWLAAAVKRKKHKKAERYTALAVGAALAIHADPDSENAIVAALTSGRISDPLTARLVSALGRIAAPAHADLLRTHLGHTSAAVRRAAASALAAAGTDTASMEALTRALQKDDDAATRGLAALSLARIGKGDALQAIEAARTSADSRVRPYATIALARAGVRGHEAKLLAQLKDDTDPSRLAACALALGLLGTKTSALQLGVVADFTGCPAQRGMTCLALGMVDAREAFPRVLRLLEKTPDRTPRLNAARALALLDRDKAGQALARIATEASNPAARVTALLSIGQLRLVDHAHRTLSIAASPREAAAVRAAALYAVGCLLEAGTPARVRVGRGMHERLDDDPLERLLPVL